MPIASMRGLPAFSSAPRAVAALVVPGSSLTLRGVGVNPLRTGLFTTLMDMGAALEFTEARVENGEPVADLRVRSAPLKGIAIGGDQVELAIDEFPAIFIQRISALIASLL